MKNQAALLSTFVCISLVVAALPRAVEARVRPEEQAAPAVTGRPAQQDLVTQAKTLSDADALSLWKSSIQSATKGNLSQAVDGFQALLDANQSAISRSLVLMTVARLFYDHGDFQKSISYYNQVGRTSDYWLEAIEERSWAYIRIDQLDTALSGLTTLMTKSLAPQVGPESYYEKAFVNFKRCDFASVFKTIDSFSEEFQVRSHRLSELAENPHDAVTEAFLNKLAAGKVTVVALGKSAREIPRLAQHDQKLIAAVHARNFEAAYRRLAELAGRDLQEIKTILHKMVLVQTESIEYMNLQESDKDAKLQRTTLGSNQMRFPYSDKEVWLDELDHYHVQSAGCSPLKKGG